MELLNDINEAAKKMVAIYFDATGAGRGPEPIAGPFHTEKEAEEYAVEMDYDLKDPDYFIDVYRD